LENGLSKTKGALAVVVGGLSNMYLRRDQESGSGAAWVTLIF